MLRIWCQNNISLQKEWHLTAKVFKFSKYEVLFAHGGDKYVRLPEKHIVELDEIDKALLFVLKEGRDKML